MHKPQVTPTRGKACRSMGYVIYEDRRLEFPVIFIFDGFDSPVEFLPKSLREKLLNRDLELFGKDNSQTWINVILRKVSESFSTCKSHTYDLAGTQRNLLIAFSVFSLKKHSGNTLVKFLDCCLALVDRWTLSFGLNLL